MPVSLPSKISAKTSSAQRNVDCITVWAISLGTSATGIAALVFFAGQEPVGAAFVLAAAATMIGIVLRETAHTPDRG